MLEIELKFPVSDRAHLLSRLRALGYTPAQPRAEVDVYFAAPDRDFAKTDEALRLRRIASTNVLTYKGPRQGTAAKTRLECEVPLADGPEAAACMEQLLGHLGYRLVGNVRKERTPLHQDWPALGPAAPFPIEVCLDDVEGLGTFAELEVIVRAEDRAGGEAAVRGLAGQLGLDRDERRSYLEMTLTRRAN